MTRSKVLCEREVKGGVEAEVNETFLTAQKIAVAGGPILEFVKSSEVMKETGKTWEKH